MKSEAILLSLEWRFSRGRFLTPRLFGYDKVEVPDGFGGKKKVLAINENEARVVRWMYSTLLNGGTPEEIAEALTELERGALLTDLTEEELERLLPLLRQALERLPEEKTAELRGMEARLMPKGTSAYV